MTRTDLFAHNRAASQDALGQGPSIDPTLIMSGVDDTFDYFGSNLLALGEDSDMQSQSKVAPQASESSDAIPGSQIQFSLLDNLCYKSPSHKPLALFDTGASYDAPRLPSSWSTPFEPFEVVWDDSSELVSTGLVSEAHSQPHSLRSNGQETNQQLPQGTAGYQATPFLSISPLLEDLEWPGCSGDLVETVTDIPKLMLDRQYWPPFVHCSIYRCSLGEVAPPVAIALSCMGAFCNMLPTSKSFVYDMINREREKLVTSFVCLHFLI